jgi:hypothetical protein
MPDYLNLSGLSSESTYTFTIAAVNVDGNSAASLATPVIRTGTAPVVSTNTPAVLAAPVFTISSASESKPVNSAIVGYTINSSGGGTVASYSISPAAPAGLTFSTSTGLLSGTPTSVASATAYTITATNASGSATRTFTLTVSAIIYTVGDTGTAGGKIFYVATTPFACGPTRTASCTYLEVAPSGWSGGADDPTRSWATNVNSNQATSVTGAVSTAIGSGYQNSLAIVAQTGNVATTSAAVLAREYQTTVSGTTYSDWYLPSKDELNQLCKWHKGDPWTSDATVCSNGAANKILNFSVNAYWSSSQVTGPGSADNVWTHTLSNGNQYSTATKLTTSFVVRPIRAG